jgi:hypothetical protein
MVNTVSGPPLIIKQHPSSQNISKRRAGSFEPAAINGAVLIQT